MSILLLIISSLNIRKGVVNISIKTLRKKKGLSQEELARMLGIGQSAVAHWETGDTSPSFKKLKKLSEILECTVDELVEDQ